MKLIAVSEENIVRLIFTYLVFLETYYAVRPSQYSMTRESRKLYLTEHLDVDAVAEA